MAMKRTIRYGLASPAICWGLGIWTAVGCVLSAPALVQQPGSGVEGRWARSVVLPTGELPFSVTFERADGAGIAVLRYDDRGVGGSTGSVARSTTSDFADDALAGIARLLERADIDPGRIGLVGHSEGAAVASLAASRSDAVRFAVLLARPVCGAEVMSEHPRPSRAQRGAIAWIDFQRRLFTAMEASEDLEPCEELVFAIRNGTTASPRRSARRSDVDGRAHARSTSRSRTSGRFVFIRSGRSARQTRVLALFGAPCR